MEVFSYKIIIHPEPPYATIPTPSGRFFKELRAPVLRKIDQFVRQCESLSLAFDLDIEGKRTDLISDTLTTALIQHFTAHQLAFAIPNLSSQTRNAVLALPTSFAWTPYFARQAARVDYVGPILRVSNIRMEALTHRDLIKAAERYPKLAGANRMRNLVFIGPLDHVVVGAYQGQPHHYCLGVRMWDWCFESDINEPSCEPQCFEGCPNLPMPALIASDSQAEEPVTPVTGPEVNVTFASLLATMSHEAPQPTRAQSESSIPEPSNLLNHWASYHEPLEDVACPSGSASSTARMITGASAINASTSAISITSDGMVGSLLSTTPFRQQISPIVNRSVIAWRRRLLDQLHGVSDYTVIRLPMV